MFSSQRRRLLKRVAGGVVGTSLWRSSRVRANAADGPSSGAESPAHPDDFDPPVHGFGFANWDGDTGTDADGEEFTYAPGDLSQEDVRRAIDDSWTTALSDAQRIFLERIVFTWIGGQAAANGHCYGMALSADNYFHNPSRLPEGVDVASEIPRPTDRFESVGDRIRWYQTSQLLRAEPYWFAFLGLRWGLGNHRVSLERLTEAIDATGTSGLALTGEPVAHQVLAHGYERSDGVTDVFIYDPTFEAEDHRNPDDVWTLSVDHESGEVHEIKSGYDEFLYHDPDMDLSTADELIGGRDRVLDETSNAVFLGVETGTALTVDVPEDVIVDRPAAEYADPDGAPYADAAVVFGSLEEFEIAIEGEAGGAFSLDALATRGGDLVLDESVSDTLEDVPTRLRFTLDETGEFVVDVVEDVEEGAETAAEEAEDAAEEAGDAAAGDATEEAGDSPEEGVSEDHEVNEGIEWIEDNWWFAVAGSALGLGAAYRFLAHRTDGDDQD